MRYSLLHRFQGALLGSFLGEIAASPQWQRGKLAVEQPFSSWQQIGLRILEILINSGQLSRQDWQRIHQQQPSNLKGTPAFAGSEIAAIAVPLTLFFHDSPSCLQKHLLAGVETWQFSEEAWEDILVWAKTLALILREKLPLPYLFTQMDSPLLEQQGISLSQVIAQLSRQFSPSQAAIALSLSCFAQTPEDFRLCVLRAAQTGSQSPSISALTGALAGAYNSVSGLPITWQLGIERHSTAQAITQRGCQLFAIWSGHYDLTSLDFLLKAAVASVQVLQPRSSLHLISQQEGQFLGRRGGERVK